MEAGFDCIEALDKGQVESREIRRQPEINRSLPT